MPFASPRCRHVARAGAATVGAAVAGYGIAQAVCSPAWGRAGDRRSLRRVVLWAQPAFTVIAAALTILASDGAFFVVLATAQGTVALPFGALMRSFWARQPDLADVQHRASTFESAMTEVVLLGARLLVSLVSLVGLVMLGAVQAVLAAAGGGQHRPGRRRCAPSRRPTRSRRSAVRSAR